MTIGSLFSGIGGLELGLEAAGLGPVLWQVEANPFRRSILRRHWPGVPIHHDVRTVGAHNLARPWLVCGGFPCQDVSSAGVQAGLAGDRSGLWRAFERILCELQPAWAIVENVASGAHLWLDDVRRDLEFAGYESLPVPLSARDLGAPHIRARVFLVARLSDPYRDREHVRPRRPEVARPPEPVPPWRGPWWSPEPDVDRVAAGVPHGLERNAALGDAVVPACGEVIGWMVRELAGLDDAPRK